MEQQSVLAESLFKKDFTPSCQRVADFMALSLGSAFFCQVAGVIEGRQGADFFLNKLSSWAARLVTWLANT